LQAGTAAKIRIIVMKKKALAKKELHTNRVFQVMVCLTPAERKRLLKYLQSPYFNQSRVMEQLAAALLQCVEKNEVGFLKEHVWTTVFGKAPFDDVNFRKHCSDLLVLVEDFMGQEVFRQDQARRDAALLRFLAERDMMPLFNITVKETRQYLESRPYKSMSDYYYLYNTEIQYHNLTKTDGKPNEDSRVKHVSDYLDTFYFIQKLKIACYTAIYNRQFSTLKSGDHAHSLSVSFSEQILEFIQKSDILEQSPELSIYYHAYLMLSERGQTEHYANLRPLLYQYGADMPKWDSAEMFDTTMSYCTAEVNAGHSQFLEEYFSLSKLAIEKQIFIDKGVFSPWRFNNIIAAALRLGHFDWTEQFIISHKQFLPEESRENTYTFSLARLYRIQKKYDKVLPLLKDVEYEDVFYSLISKAMLTMTYYELSEWDALESFLKAFQVFLTRNKSLAAARKRGYLNLIKYTRRLMRLQPGETAKIVSLREEVEREKQHVVNHEWLLEKLGTLI
jgi:hypothetical protein